MWIIYKNKKGDKSFDGKKQYNTIGKVDKYLLQLLGYPYKNDV